MQDNQSSIIEKLEKLLRLSESPEQGEAESAMRMAINLATKHNIDLSKVQTKEKKLVFSTISFNIGQRLPIAQRFITPILIKFFQVRIVYSGGRFNGRKIVYLGTDENAKMAMHVNNFLNEVFLSLWRVYSKKNNLSTTYRDSYFMGLAQGFSHKMQMEQQETIQKMLPVASEREEYGLVLVSHKEQLVKYESTVFPKLGTYQSRAMTINDTVRNDGFIKGKDIHIHAGCLQ